MTLIQMFGFKKLQRRDLARFKPLNPCPLKKKTSAIQGLLADASDSGLGLALTPSQSAGIYNTEPSDSIELHS